MASLHVTTIQEDPALARLFAIFGAAECCWFASTRSGGRAHLAPIWHVVHADRIYIVSQAGSVRVANLRQSPHASLALPDPLNVLVVEGIARLAPVQRTVLQPLFLAKFDWDIATDAEYNTVIELTPRKVMTWGRYGEGRWLIGE